MSGVTMTDEVGRQQRVTADVLGRVLKTEILNTDGTTYATTTNTYNVRDQITNRLRLVCRSYTRA